MNCVEPGCNGAISEKGVEVPVGCNRGLTRPTIEVFGCERCGRTHTFNEKKELVGVFSSNEEKVFQIDGTIIHRK